MSNKSQLNRGLSTRHIRFLALGSAIGTGLFYGSASAISTAGPAVLLAYIIAGVVVYIVMRSLGEMAVLNPISGSFSYYATKYIGRWAGLTTGWTYVFEMVVVSVTDLTAFGIYMKFWFPNVEQWVWCLALFLLLGGINLINVKVFGEIEFWLSIIKVGAILAMIAGGLLLMIWGMTTGRDDRAGIVPGIQNLWDHGGFMPNGLWGLVACLAIVIFAFGGIEIIGITAGESANPKKSIPQAINSVPARILIFYVLTIFVFLCIFPWNEINGEASPFVQIFQSLNVTAAADILNVIVIAAAISAINSDVFGAGRILYGMSTTGQAPQIFTKTFKNGVPWMTVLVMACALGGGVILNLLLPEDVFNIIASVAAFATIWVWLMILLSQIGMRKKLSPEQVKQLGFPVFGWPVAQWFAVGFLVFVLIIMACIPESQSALVVGGVWIGLLSLGYWGYKQKINRIRILH